MKRGEIENVAERLKKQRIQCYSVKVDEEEVMMMPHMDDVDLFDFESTNNLIPRKTFSVISIQRPFGSRASLASRKRSMMFDQLRGRIAKKQ